MFHHVTDISLFQIATISFEYFQHKLLQNMADNLDEEKGEIALPTRDEDFKEQSNDSEVVTWALPYDARNPMQWPSQRRWAITLAMGGMTLVVTFASSVFSTAIRATAEEFHVSTEVTTFGISLYILVWFPTHLKNKFNHFKGFGLGPIIWGPTSEFLGRWAPFFGAYIVFLIFQIPVAVAQNLETILLCRFLGGLFGAGPLAVTAGVMADMWGPIDRGAGIAIFGLATFMGPGLGKSSVLICNCISLSCRYLGPIVGGFLTQSSLGWRWTAWITLIMGTLFALIGLFIIPETYAPLLLSRRASKLRHETKNWAIHAQFDEKRLDFNAILNTYLLLPLKMLAQETILFLVSLYLSLVYCVLYLSFEAFPISFQEERDWGEGVGSLPFISLLVGFIIGGVIIFIQNYGGYAKVVREKGQAPPEARLPPMMIGAVTFPIGLFVRTIPIFNARFWFLTPIF